MLECLQNFLDKHGIDARRARIVGLSLIPLAPPHLACTDDSAALVAEEGTQATATDSGDETDVTDESGAETGETSGPDLGEDLPGGMDTDDGWRVDHVDCTAQTIAPDSMGNLYVGGACGQPTLTKYDDNGQWIWTSNIEKDGSITDISINDQDEIYITGSLSHLGEKYAFVAQYDIEGNQKWLEEMEIDLDSGKAIFAHEDGFFVVVETRDLVNQRIGHLMAYDQDVNPIWSQELTTSNSDGLDDDISLRSIDYKNGSVVVSAGITQEFYDFYAGLDLGLWAFHESGSLIWGHRFYGEENIQAYDAKIGSDSSTYIAGQIQGGENANEALLLALNPDQTERWRWKDGPQGVFRGLQLAPDGTIYAGGTTWSAADGPYVGQFSNPINNDEPDILWDAQGPQQDTIIRDIVFSIVDEELRLNVVGGKNNDYYVRQYVLH